MAKRKLTFEAFQRRMIAHAKAVQGERYPGDKYYLQDDPCWRDPYNEGVTPEKAVDDDMEYWESEAVAVEGERK